MRSAARGGMADSADPDAGVAGFGGGDRWRIHHARRHALFDRRFLWRVSRCCWGVDRFMSQMRSVMNLIGNGVATIVVAKWDKEFDEDRSAMLLNGADVTADELAER